MVFNLWDTLSTSRKMFGVLIEYIVHNVVLDYLLKLLEQGL